MNLKRKSKSPYIVFSAPSGTGKTTIVNMLVEKYPEMAISISATTRKKRDYETDGKEYFFLTVEEFKAAISTGKFLEYEEVHGDYYGTLKEKVEALKNNGKVVLFDIDVNGAKSIKRNCTEAILIFLKPPGREELINRLKNRNSETDETISRRLQRLDYEYEQSADFDHIIVNSSLDKTLAEVEQAIFEK
jgi:guanylate kinase